MAASDVKNDPTLSTNLVSYWELEEASGSRVDSHSTNDLTDNNTVTQSTGIQGNDAVFDDANSEYLSIADASQSGLDISGAVSISCWVKITNNPSSGQYYGLVCKGGINTAISDTATQYVLWYDNDGTYRVHFGIRGTGVWKDNTYNFQLTPGTWYHLVGVYDPSNEVSLWVNNVKQATNTTSIPASLVNTAQPFVIGNMYSGTPGMYADVEIDEVGIWDKKISDAEISDLYNSGSGIPYEVPTVVTTVQAKARVVQEDIIKTTTSKARIIQEGVADTIQAKAAVKESDISKTVQAKAYVQAEAIKFITAKAALSKTGVSKDSQAKARVQFMDLAKTITAKSKISVTDVVRTITAKSHIWSSREGFVSMRNYDQNYNNSMSDGRILE